MILIFMPMGLKSSQDILTGVYRAADERNWRVQVFNRFPSRPQLREILRDWRPSGCLVYTGESRDLLPPAAFGVLPVAYLSDRRPGRFTVNQDAAVTARLAADELSLCGARSFVYVAPDHDALWSRERCRAFQDEAQSRKLPFRKFRSGHLGLESVLRQLPKPVGILAAADAYAAKVILTAERAGYSIPGDINLVSVDNDTRICENLHPTLTSVEHNFEKAGYLLASLIAARQENPALTPFGLTYAPLRLIRRASTRPNGMPPEIKQAMEYVRLHATEGIGVSDVAHALGINRRALERMVVGRDNCSIATLIRKEKLNRVLELLKKRNQAIGPIASLCGFSSEAHLKTLFKRTYGQTMRDWRKTHLTTKF